MLFMFLKRVLLNFFQRYLLFMTYVILVILIILSIFIKKYYDRDTSDKTYQAIS